MEPWQGRVVAEERQLEERLTKLEAFIAERKAPTFEDERLLIEQAAAMRTYLTVLRLRGARW